MPAGDRTAWGAVAIITLAGAVASAHVGKLPPALPPIRAELGFGLVAGGFLLSLFNVLGMSVAAVIGGLIDRVGRERLVAAGFAALVAGGVSGAFAPGLSVLMASRLLEGLGFIAVTVALPFVMTHAAAPRDRGFVQGVWSVYHPLGMALAMLAAPLLMQALGWHGLWLALAALCPLIGWAVLVQMRALDVPCPPPARIGAVLRQALAHPPFRRIAMIFMAYAFQWATLMAWLPTFLTEAFGASVGGAALVTALVVLVNVPGCLFGGLLVRRGLGPGTLILTGAVILAICQVGIFLPWLSESARVALALVFSFFGGLLPPSLFNGVQQTAPAPALVGAGNGMLMQGSALGQFVGAPLVGWAVASADGDWSAALGPMLGAAALTVIGGILTARAQRG